MAVEEYVGLHGLGGERRSGFDRLGTGRSRINCDASPQLNNLNTNGIPPDYYLVTEM